MTPKTLLLTLILLTTTLLHSSNTIIKLDTKGHTAMINDVIVTKLKDIITSSNDKTIRVWDSHTGKEKRKILGQIGEGREGMIFTMALSPNEEFLVVVGFWGILNNPSEACGIRIYNYQSGKLIKVLKSHTNIVFDLSFSKDGKYLISGSGDNTAKIWSVEKNFALKDTITSHSDSIYAVKIIKKDGKYLALSAGYDNKVFLYDMDRKETVKERKFSDKLRYLATTSKEIALCRKGKEIIIMDYTLNIKKTIHLETKPSGVSYSPNGKYLIVGTANSPYNVNIYNQKGYSLVSSFKKHTNNTMAVGFLDNQTAISAGGDNFEIYLWDIKSGTIDKKIEGVGEIVWSVGVVGDKIAWGNEGTARKGKSKLQKSINLKTFQISEQGRKSLFHRISTTNDNYSLTHTKGGNYRRNNGVLVIKKGSQKVAKIIRGFTNGLGHNCYGWYRDYIISGGGNGFLKIYNKQGKEVGNLVGHTGEVYSIALDGDRLVSGSADKTIKIWDLSFLEAGTLVPKSTTTKVVAPTLTLFVSKDNEWVVWSPSGYYNASVGGAKYVGFHINHGAEHEAEFLTLEEAKKMLYRPDIITKVLNGEDISKEEKKINIKELIKAK